MNTRRTTLALSVLGLAAASTLSGCANSQDTSIQALRGNLTPELSTLAQTPYMVNNQRAITLNQHFRALPEDASRLLFYADRPTRLTPYPVSY